MVAGTPTPSTATRDHIPSGPPMSVDPTHDQPGTRIAARSPVVSEAKSAEWQGGVSRAHNGDRRPRAGPRGVTWESLTKISARIRVESWPGSESR